MGVSVIQGVPDASDPLDLPFDSHARFPNPIVYERDARPRHHRNFAERDLDILISRGTG